MCDSLVARVAWTGVMAEDKKWVDLRSAPEVQMQSSSRMMLLLLLQ